MGSRLQEYPTHPPTLLVQPLSDNNADVDAARFYHQAMVAAHGGTSVHFAAGGSVHTVSPAAFGVVASWVDALIHQDRTALDGGQTPGEPHDGSGRRSL